MKSILKLFFWLTFFAVGFAGWKSWDFFFTQPPSKSDSWTVDIAPGATLNTLRGQLESQGHKVDLWVFKIWARFASKKFTLKAGEYEVPSGLTAFQTLNHILTASPKMYQFTVKEGFSVWDILPILKNLQINENEKAKFEELLKNKNILEAQGFRSSADSGSSDRFWLEGFLFPETYTYQKYDSAEKIIGAMTSEFLKRIAPILKDHPWAETPEGRYNLIVLASIVEKESGLFEEQPLVASVFWNRIQKKMRLQSDPTTIYGLMPNFDGNLKRIHLTTPSQFNTYTLPFLPVGPISNPGLKAVEAVLKPETSQYIYFVAKGDGTHVFSKDLKTHNSYVRDYQILRKGIRANGESKDSNR